VTARRLSRSQPGRTVVVLAAALLGVLACAACSGSSPAASSLPKPRHLTPEQAAPLLVQCFADKHLITASELATGKDSLPPSDSSTWMHDGKVTGNLRFGDWYSIAGSAITVDGKMIVDWVSAVAANSKAWPKGVCGPLPS
jgi:hypothetical protein